MHKAVLLCQFLPLRAFGASRSRALSPPAVFGRFFYQRHHGMYCLTAHFFLPSFFLFSCSSFADDFYLFISLFIFPCRGLGFDALAVMLEVACCDCEPDGKSFPRMVFLFPLLVEFCVVWCFVGSPAARHVELLDDLLSLLPRRAGGAEYNLQLI